MENKNTNLPPERTPKQVASANLKQQQDNVPVVPQAIITDSSAIITTPGSKGGKKLALIILIVGIVLSSLAAGGYYYYTQNIKKTPIVSTQVILPQPTVTSLPTSAVKPTAVPTLAELEDNLLGCDQLELFATESAFLQSYCDGGVCLAAETQNECEEIDVVATTSGQLKDTLEGDGTGDCVWSESSFGVGTCSPKY